MRLQDIYNSIKYELKEVESVLDTSLKKSERQFIQNMGNFLLEEPGKRIRPALLILSAKATLNGSESLYSSGQLIGLASAVELIHMASLIHDDIIDRAKLRHNRPTVNFKWGEDISIALGDYLYAVAFGLISQCRDGNILQCISSAVRAMCEGELLQVWERRNIDLPESEYLFMIKKKTASLFSACCQVGVLMSGSHNIIKEMEDYGTNLGIAFQIIDDYLDLMGEEKKLGKDSGQDIRRGEITLPMLKLREYLSEDERRELKARIDGSLFQRIRNKVLEYKIDSTTREITMSFITTAKDRLSILPDSTYKESLLTLADFIVERGFNDKC